jgi:adenylate cyclase class 2
MKEIEIKILEINPKEIEKKIISLGGTKIGSYFVKENFYDFPNHKLKATWSILRLRTLGKKTEFTFKHATKKMMTSTLAVREEIQTEVSDAKELEKIILALGLVLVRSREKKRTSFILGKTKANQVCIEIDKYPGVPSYLEVEGNEKSIPDAVKALGFTMKDATNLTSSKVLKKYGKNTDFLKFGNKKIKQNKRKK